MIGSVKTLTRMYRWFPAAGSHGLKYQSSQDLFKTFPTKDTLWWM